MIFGDKFYSYLKKLRPWQCSLFALILAERMRINYLLYCQMNNDRNHANLYKDVLDKLWLYHTDKFNHVDLKLLNKALNKCMPNLDDDTSFGASMASDAVATLLCAINAIVDRHGNEALQASDISEQSLIKFIELNEGTQLSDEELLEHQMMEEEIEFQVSLLDELRKDDRNLLKPLKYRDQIRKSKVSNIGISLED